MPFRTNVLSIKSLLEFSEHGVNMVKSLLAPVVGAILGHLCPVVDVKYPLGHLLVTGGLHLLFYQGLVARKIGNKIVAKLAQLLVEKSDNVVAGLAPAGH